MFRRVFLPGIILCPLQVDEIRLYQSKIYLLQIPERSKEIELTEISDLKYLSLQEKGFNLLHSVVETRMLSQC